VGIFFQKKNGGCIVTMNPPLAFEETAGRPAA
jgi:hypothetical protein